MDYRVESSARKVAERLLDGAVESLTDPRTPRGCFVVQGGLVCGDEAESVRAALAERRKAADLALRRRMERARKEGDLPKRADPAVLANFLSTVIRGMSVQAASGATRKQLQQVAELALRAWPN